MAIFHLSVSAIQRSKGHSATAAAAYRSGTNLTDQRTGERHTYARKQRGVEHAEIVMPPEAKWKPSRAELWNAAELAEKRKDGTPAREHVIALPAELTNAQRLDLTRAYALDLAKRHGCAVDFAIHRPRTGGNNWHAHVLCTTRKVEGLGLGAKCDREKAGRQRATELKDERKRWEDFANAYLKHFGHADRIDHRSLKDQGIDREPTKHLGKRASRIKAMQEQLAEIDAQLPPPPPLTKPGAGAARSTVTPAPKPTPTPTATELPGLRRQQQKLEARLAARRAASEPTPAPTPAPTPTGFVPGEVVAGRKVFAAQEGWDYSGEVIAIKDDQVLLEFNGREKHAVALPIREFNPPPVEGQIRYLSCRDGKVIDTTPLPNRDGRTR